MAEFIKPEREKNKILMEMVTKYGYCTVWELFQQYGIDRQKTTRAIRAGKLLAFMKGGVDKNGDEYRGLKWYIVKNQDLEEYIDKNRIK